MFLRKRKKKSYIKLAFHYFLYVPAITYFWLLECNIWLWSLSIKLDFHNQLLCFQAMCLPNYDNIPIQTKCVYEPSTAVEDVRSLDWVLNHIRLVWASLQISWENLKAVKEQSQCTWCTEESSTFAKLV